MHSLQVQYTLFKYLMFIVTWENSLISLNSNAHNNMHNDISVTELVILQKPVVVFVFNVTKLLLITGTKINAASFINSHSITNFGQTYLIIVTEYIYFILYSSINCGSMLPAAHVSDCLNVL